MLYAHHTSVSPLSSNIFTSTLVPMSTYRELAGNYALSLTNGAQATPQDLDYLIQTLRNPAPNVTIQQVLGYMYNYTPFIKHEHNLRLVFLSFLNNAVCFSPPIPSFEENYLIVEVFKLISEKKLKVSQPALSIKDFYSIILTEVTNFVHFNPNQNSWKALPILTGLWLSNDLRNELYVNNDPLHYKLFFNDWDAKADALFKTCFVRSIGRSTPPDLSNLALLCLSLKFHAPKDELSDYIRLVQPGLLIRQLIHLMFSKSGSLATYTKFADIDPLSSNVTNILQDHIFNKPVLKHLNKVSTLTGALFKLLPPLTDLFILIMDLMSRMLDFNRAMNHFSAASPILNVEFGTSQTLGSFIDHYWILMKSILFAEMIIYRDVLSRFISLGRRPLWSGILDSSNFNVLEQEYRQVSMVIIHSLYYLHYILTAVGQGGFDIYNFVYYVSLEVCIKNNNDAEFENFSKYLFGNYQEINLHYESLNRNYVARCKVMFAFGLWEYYLQESKHVQPGFVPFIHQHVFDIVKNPHLTDVQLLEAGHSVLLVYFSKSDINLVNVHHVLEYLELIVDQHSRSLSAAQLSIAVETLGKKTLSNPINYGNGLFSNSAEEFMNFMYSKCLNTPSAQPIRATRGILVSAQPITKIDAESTLSQLGEDNHVDVLSENKHKKPKDNHNIDLILMSNDTSMSNFSVRFAPNTSREAIILAFLNTIPYFPLGSFEHWLNKIMGLIRASNTNEQAFLIDKLWKVLSENLDLNRSDIAYNWWYHKLHAVERNLCRSMQRMNL